MLESVFFALEGPRKNDYDPNLSLDYYSKPRYIVPSSLFEGRLRRHPEGGARSGVLRRAACKPLASGGPGPRPLGTTTWLRGARCTDPKATARRCRTAGAQGDGSAAPRPKIAAVERREASVPRHGTQGASLGAWPAALRAGRTGVPPSTRTFLGPPPTPPSE